MFNNPKSLTLVSQNKTSPLTASLSPSGSMTPTQVANPSKTSLRSTANSICDTTKKSQQFYLENFPGQHLQDKNGKSKASLKSAFEVMEKYKGQEMLHETDSEVSSAEDNEFEIDDDEDQSDAEIKVEDD